MKNLLPHFIVENYQKGILNGRFWAASMLIDISGFTRLTQALFPYGKEGEEKLTHALNNLISQPIRHVYSQGGFVTSFTGDGFIALFPGKEGALSAVSVATQIRDFVASQSAVQTPSGEFPLNVRIGIGCGSVDWGILGPENQLTYYFMGQAIKRGVKAEKQAEIGEIVTVVALRHLLGEQANFRLRDRYFYDVTLPTLLPEKPVQIAELSVEQTIPFGLARIMGLDTRAEFRDVATVFLSLKELSAGLNDFVNHVLVTSKAYGGYFNKFEFADKNGVMLIVFGAPFSQENNLERAAEFLLKLQKASLPIQWRAGLTYGTVYAGIVGGVERSEYTVIGNEVNLSARLMTGDSKWNIIRVSQAAAKRLEQHGYQFKSLGKKEFKGNIEVEVESLQDKQSGFDPIVTYKTTMVGRDKELHLLSDALLPLREGRFGGVIAIHGQAGAGKTRLIYELRQRSVDVLWMKTKADDLLRHSLNPFRSLLQRYFDQNHHKSAAENQERFDARLDDLINFLTKNNSLDLAQELNHMRVFLASAVDLYSDSYLQSKEDQRSDNLLISIKRFIQAESLRQPLVLHVEDAHRLDSDSNTLIHKLTQYTDAFPFLLLLTYRYKDDGIAFAPPIESETILHTVHLKPLESQQVSSLIRELLGQNVSQSILTLLEKKTGGNPLFIEHLIYHLVDEHAQRKDTNWRVTIEEINSLPDTVKGILTTRLDNIVDAKVKSLVQRASVLHRAFTLELLTAIQGNRPDTELLVQQAVALAILSPVGMNTYDFSHDLMRDAAYDMQGFVDKRNLHLQVAEIIEQLYASSMGEVVSDLAYHFRRAGERKRERHYTELAAQRAFEITYDNESALVYLKRLLELAPSTDVQTPYSVLLLREQVYDRLGQRNAQFDDLEELDQLTVNSSQIERRTTVLMRYARYLNITDDNEQAISYVTQILDISKTHNLVEQEIRANLLAGEIHRATSKYDAARMVYEHALELIQPSVWPQLKAQALKQLGAVKLDQWDASAKATVEPLLEEAFSIYSELRDQEGQAETLVNQGVAAFKLGKFSDSGKKLKRAVDLFSEIGNKRREAQARLNLGVVSGASGNAIEAVAELNQLLPLVREIGDRNTERKVTLSLAGAELIQGHFSAAAKAFEDNIEACKKLGDVDTRARSCINLGLIYRYQGKYDKSHLRYDEALGIFQKIDSEAGKTDAAFGFAMLSAELGEYDNAQQQYLAALDAYRQLGEQQSEADVMHSLSLLFWQTGQFEDALKYAEQALSLATDIEEPSLQGYAHTSIARILASQGQLDDAAKHYEEAQTLRDENGEIYLLPENWAGLAEIAYKQNDHETAINNLEQVWQYWFEPRSFDGCSEPMLVYLTCYEVLKALGDKRAEEILEAACKQLNERADKHITPDARERYLNGIKVHAKLLSLRKSS